MFEKSDRSHLYMAFSFPRVSNSELSLSSFVPDRAIRAPANDNFLAIADPKLPVAPVKSTTLSSMLIIFPLNLTR